MSHLYGRARDLCKSIYDYVVTRKDGVDAIVASYHKRDPLTVVSMVYDKMLQLVHYESVATVLRQCDNQRIVDQFAQTMHSSSVHVPSSYNRDSRKPKVKKFNNYTREMIMHAKSTSQCKCCGNYGHWFGDHNEDGSVNDHVPNSSTPIGGTKGKPKANDAVTSAKPDSTSRVLKFRTATTTLNLHDSSTPIMTIQLLNNNVGLLVDSGASY